MFSLPFVPITALVAYILWAAARQEEALAYRQSSRWANITAANQQQLVMGAEQLLRMLTLVPAIRTGVEPDCSQALARVRADHPQFTNFGVIRADGRLICSALPAAELNLSDRSYFRDALQGRFAVGAYQVGRVTGKPAINFAYPVPAERGRVERVVYAALGLEWLADWAAQANLPPGSAFSLLDSAGTVVARFPELASVVGRPHTVAPIINALRGGESEVTARARGLDGVERLYAASTVRIAQSRGVLHAVVGVPTEQVFAGARQLSRRSGLVLLTLLVLTVAVGWLAADWLVLRRVDVLLAATRRVGAGDLSARTGWVSHDQDEVGQLAADFDRMADSLQTQHALIQRTREADRFLADAGHVLTSSLNYQQTLQQLAELAVARFADWCVLHVRPAEPTGHFFTLVHHTDPGKRRVAAELTERYPDDPENPDRPLGQVMRSGQPALIREVTIPMIEQSARDEEHKRLLLALGFCSAMIVPLRVGGQTMGALTLVSAESRRVFTEDDLRLAEELGRRAAVAIANARLYQASQAELEKRVRAEDEVRALNAELEERVSKRTALLDAANRELEAFSYSVSHDLRSPLRSIDGFSQALLEDYETQLDETGKDYLRRVRAAAQRMGSLIDDLLALARISRKQLAWQPVDLSALAASVTRELQEQHPGRSVEVRVQPGLYAEGDPGLLRVLLVNLLSNAWKFTARQAHPVIEFGTTGRNGDRTFFVRDNGVGFDMIYADKLFGAFQRLHNHEDFEGTGIGLATVQRVLTRHGGRVWAQAAVNRGATFYFTI